MGQHNEFGIAWREVKSKGRKPETKFLFICGLNPQRQASEIRSGPASLQSVSSGSGPASLQSLRSNSSAAAAASDHSSTPFDKSAFEYDVRDGKPLVFGYA